MMILYAKNLDIRTCSGRFLGMLSYNVGHVKVNLPKKSFAKEYVNVGMIAPLKSEDRGLDNLQPNYSEEAYS